MTLAPGATIAGGAPARRYVVERLLGRGTMGVVYEVSDPALPGRRLALKQVQRAQADAEGWLRFEREARLLARVRHPHVLPVHELVLGTGELGPYLVTDLVTGEPLDAALARGPLPPRRAAEVARGVADALAAVHAAGIVHRDVKPANVTLDAATGAPVLIDFGLARHADSAGLTRTGTFVGTVAYLSPEQRDGQLRSGAPIDGRADVWSLGLVLWECLAGRPAFDGPVGQVLVQLDGGPAPLAQVAPAVPRGLAAIVAAATVVDPAGRYPSAAALRDDLDRWLRGEAPVVAPARGRRALLAGLAAVALAALAALVARPGPASAGPASTSSTTGAPAPPAPSSAPGATAPVVFAPAPQAPGPRRLTGWLERWAAGRRTGWEVDRLREGPLLLLPSLEADARLAPVAWLDSRCLLVGSFLLPRVLRHDLAGAPARSTFLDHPDASGGIRALAVGGPEGGPRVVAVGLDEGRAALHDARGALLRAWSPPADVPLVTTSERRNTFVDLDAAGRTLVVAGPWVEGWTYAVGDAGLERQTTLRPLPRAARGVALSPDGRAAAVLAADRVGGVEVEQAVLLGPGVGVALVDARAPRGRCLAFTPDGAELLVGDVSGSVRRVALRDPPADLDGAPRLGDPLAGELEALSFSPDRTALLVLEARGDVARVIALRWPAGTVTWRSPPFVKARGLAWSPDGALVAVGHEDGSASVWAAPP